MTLVIVYSNREQPEITVKKVLSKTPRRLEVEVNQFSNQDFYDSTSKPKAVATAVEEKPEEKCCFLY